MPYPRYSPTRTNQPHLPTCPPGRPCRVSMLTGPFTIASSFAGLYHGWCWSGWLLDWALIALQQRPMEKMPHPQLEPARASSKQREMTHRSGGQIGVVPRSAPLDSAACCVRHALSQFQSLVASGSGPIELQCVRRLSTDSQSRTLVHTSGE
jgi:hypothetical protein